MKVIATAGHVDHGKSSLLRALSGMEPDRWAEERRRGLTIDLGYVWTELTSSDDRQVRIAFVDVPGHDAYLTNMLAGVGVVQDVLLVVAADDGWAQQTQEHLEIVSLLGGRIAAAAVTKTCVAGTTQTRAVVDDVARRIAEVGLEVPDIFAVDSIEGTGVADVAMGIADRVIDRVGPPSGDPVRIRIDRAFTVKGAGTVITGMLQQGTVEVGQELAVLPSEQFGRVRSLQSLGLAVERAEAPARVAIDLGRVDQRHLVRGAALVALDDGRRPWGRATREIDVLLHALPYWGIGRTGAWHVHLGTASTTVRIFPVLEEVEPGGSGAARLELSEALPTWTGERFVLREAGRRRTVGGGVVLDPHPLTRPRGADHRLSHALVLEALSEAADQPGRVLALVEAHGGLRDRRSLQLSMGRELDEHPSLSLLGDALVGTDRLEVWLSAVVQVADDVEGGHAVDATRLAGAAEAAGCPSSCSRAVVAQAAQRGEIRNFGGRFVHVRHVDDYLAARTQRQERFLAVLNQQPLEPPDPTAAASDVGVPSFEIQELIDDGRVAVCGPLLFSARAIAQAMERLREGPGEHGQPFSASEARQAWGTTRRCAVPLLEHLQGIGATSFDGTHHSLRGV